MPAAAADPVGAAAPPPLPAYNCENCGTALEGEYCSACGQRYEPHVHSLGHFASEAFESVTHADSRLWRTIGYLLTRPGFLSREFFEGRRARYLPPFRLYLVISVLFFVVAGLAGHMSVEDAEDGPPTAEKVEALKQSADALEKDNPNTPGIPQAAAAIRERAAEQQAILEGKTPSVAVPDAEPKDRPEVHNNFCAKNMQPPGPDARWFKQTAHRVCQKVSRMRGDDLVNAFVHNIPRAMFVFLPLLAAVMKLLYWRPKRYYVEHLLFLVHNHAFVFLAMAILVMLARIPVVGDYVGLLATATWLYVIYYVFRAMRVFYGQSRTLTFSKYVVVGLAYATSAVIVLVGTALYTAITL